MDIDSYQKLADSYQKLVDLVNSGSPPSIIYHEITQEEIDQSKRIIVDYLIKDTERDQM